MSSKNNTEPTRRRLSKKAVVAISAVAVLALAGGAAFAVNAANQAKINAACQEAATSYELAAQAYVTAEQELSNVVTEAREETSRGYADTEEGTALLVQADQRLALGVIATEAPDCRSHETAEQISSQASGLDADTEAINALAADITEAVDEHIINAATADYDTVLTAYNDAKTAGEASYEAANTTESFAGSAENAGKLEALRGALDAKPDMGEAPTTRAEVTALDEAIAAINAAKAKVDTAREALDGAVTSYNDRIAAEKTAAEEAARKAEAERKAAAAHKAASNNSSQSSKSSGGNKSSKSNNSSGLKKATPEMCANHVRTTGIDYSGCPVYEDRPSGSVAGWRIMRNLTTYTYPISNGWNYESAQAHATEKGLGKLEPYYESYERVCVENCG